jgi:hypothetical protein
MSERFAVFLLSIILALACLVTVNIMFRGVLQRDLAEIKELLVKCQARVDTYEAIKIKSKE